MRIENLHAWDVSFAEALEIQRNLAKMVTQHGSLSQPKLIAGLDVSVSRRKEATAVAVVLSFPALEVVETAVARGETVFPYIPGLLSFREMPLTLKAWEQLSSRPDLVLVDGQGIAHPRGIGLASHLGLFLNVPTIGCAKSPLFGNYELPQESAGSHTDIANASGEVIGAVLRTRSGVRPLFISVGHKIDLTSAIYWVLQCCRGYRLPEPTRRAHLASKAGSLPFSR